MLLISIKCMKDWIVSDETLTLLLSEGELTNSANSTSTERQ